jgi:hypothetical protein
LRNRLPLAIYLLLIILAGMARTVANAQDTLTFQFSGVVRYLQSNPIPDIAVGDLFLGSYTFKALTPGAPPSYNDGTIDTVYANAVSLWSVSIPSRGLTFAGTSGDIMVGNDTSFYKSDRYIATLYPDAGTSGVPSGSMLTYFQIDLFRYGCGWGSPLLQDSSIQITPPDLALVQAGDSIGHFMFDIAEYQTWTQTLTAVPIPEPSSLSLLVGLLVVKLSLRRFRPRSVRYKRAETGQTVDLPQEGLALGRRWHVRDCCLHARRINP